MIKYPTILPHVDASGLIRLALLILLLATASRWQKNYEEIKGTLFKEKFLVDEKMNSYLLETLGTTELERARVVFIKLCQSISSCGVVPPFIHYESRQMIAPKYRTATCVIYKNMSTIMTAIMCYLYDVLSYQRNVFDIALDTYPRRFCKGKNEYDSIRVVESFQNTTSRTEPPWLNILVVRDPLQRFLSAFINKCLRENNRPNACYNCGGDLQCVMERQYERLMGGAQTPSIVHTVEDAHFAPQTWHCELRDNIRKYRIIKYTGTNTEEMLSKLEVEFKNRGVGQGIIDDIREKVLRKRTIHSTYNSYKRVFYERQLRSSPYLMTLLVKMFYYDYLLFGYPLPKIF